MILKAEDWEEWFYHRCTQQFLQDMRENRQGVLEFLAGGGTVEVDNGDATLQLTSKEVGRAHAILQIIEIIEDCKPSPKAKEDKDDPS